jgi:hypothetical protein
MKNKADEVHLQAKAKDFGDAVAEMVKAAVSIAARYAKENREKVDGALDKVEGTISERTNGKHTDTVSKVRAGVDKGIDKLVEKSGSQTAAPGSTGSAGSTTGSSVPDDRHSAFDDDTPEGSPS